MIFTRDQIEEIRKKLFEMGVTDLSMPEADTPLSGTEVISLVQNGVNKKINISDFWRRYASYFENERWEAYREAEQAREADYKSLKVMINDGERSRNQAEQERSANETARLDAEEDRYQAEIIRQQEFNTIKNQLEELIDEGGIGELNVQADWNENDDTQDSFIKNKPDVYTSSQTDSAIQNAIRDKADKVSSAVSGDIATLDANGNLTDSGKKVSDFAPQSSTYTKQEVDAAIEAIDVSSQISGKANKSEMSVSTNGDKTTITLKTGTYAEMINQHQDISGKLDNPSGGTVGQVLTKTADGVAWDDASSGGVSDYDDLTDKPSINNVPLSGNKSASDLGLVGASDGVYIGEAYGQGDNPEASFNAFSDTVWNKAQTLSAAQKNQVRSNIDAGRVDSITVNNVNYTPTNGVVDLGTISGGGGSGEANVLEGVAVKVGSGSASDLTIINKKVTLNYDSTPTSASNNPVTSGGVYTALSGKVGSSDITSIVKITQADYDLINTPDSHTLYIIIAS